MPQIIWNSKEQWAELLLYFTWNIHGVNEFLELEDSLKF